MVSSSSMGDDGLIHRLGHAKALLGILAGAGASYGIYKLVQKRSRTKSVDSGGHENRTGVEPGSLIAKVSGFNVVGAPGSSSGDIFTKSPGSLEPHHIGMLLSLLQKNPNPSERAQVLLTLGNAAAFTVNQDLIHDLGGLHVIAGYLSNPSADVRVQSLNALNNLSMNLKNQEHLKVYVPQVLELIEISPVNSDLQLAALRLLTNMSVTDKHQHLLKSSITLFLSLLVVANEALQIQVLKVLVNLSSNPDMMEDIVQSQAPASLVLLFDRCTSVAVLLRLLTFVGNLRAWRPSTQVAQALRWRQESLYCVLLDESSQLHHRLPLLLSHPDGEIKAQVARTLT
ncbi:armadillo repeat-containing protein 10 [Denticeps clupeoides]|uniref:Armadillo repeat-containing domain-containing protein n=1 Tax=Denticeps clupeoides TaxID=299321 RepID=A0AAY4CBT5_9TELE|nr:armadillo repeat-containing protein 10 [Denticeps clupeoides]